MNLLKKILILADIVYRCLINLLKKNLLSFTILKKVNPNNFRYKYQTERRNPKDLSNYQNLIELFVNLRDGNLNSKEALKSQINFKSDLDKIKKQNQKSKTEDQISLIQNVQKLLDLRGKIVDFLKIIFFCYLKLNTKQIVEWVSKYSLLNKCFKYFQ